MKNVIRKLVPDPLLFSKNLLERGFCGGQHDDLDKF